MLLLSSCGGGSQSAQGTYHCATDAVAPKACIEYTNLGPDVLSAAMSACSTGTWGSGTCPRTNLLGGCEIANSIEWYYVGGRLASAADIMSQCAAEGGTFVPPP